MAGSRSEREVKIRFTGESQVLKGSAGEVRKVFQMLQSDLNDARGAGEKLAQAYQQVADSMTRDMEDIARTADVVRDSLGPEMTAALEANGRSVEDQVQDWRKLGLTLDDITRDSDQLADGLRRMDASARQSTGAVGDGMRKIGAETENSRSVMANFAGNAIQELPGVAGAMGPLNMAIGQFAEYATEGNIKLKNLLATGAGIGIAALAMQAFADRASKLAEVKAIDAEAVEGYADALAEAGTRAEAIANHLREIEKIQVTIGADGGFWTGGVTGAVDLTAAFVALGLQADDTAELIAGGTERIDAWGAAMIEAGAEAGVVTTAMYGMKQQVDAVATATENNARTQAFLGEETANVTRELDRGADSLDDHMSATTRDRLAQEALTRAFERNEEAQRSLTDARMSQFDQEFAYRAAVDQLAVSLESLANATDDPKTATNEFATAQDDAARAALDMAGAYQTSAEQLAASAGAPLTAAQSQQKFIESLYQTALSLAPDSPLRKQLIGYITDLQTTPGTVPTKIELDAEDANTRIGFHRQKNVDAKVAVDDLKTSLDALPPSVDIPFSLTGYTVTMTQLQNMLNRLQEVADEADRADRAVGRVAG